MEILDIKKFPNDILRQKCKAVDGITTTERDLFNKMLFTMRHFSGIGLAASQVGLPIRLFVVEVENDVIKLANPKVKKKEGKDRMMEGCLSLPDTEVEVERPYKITITGLNDIGEQTEINAKGLLARVLQHEIDHLNGQLIIDYMNFWQRRKYVRRKK